MGSLHHTLAAKGFTVIEWPVHRSLLSLAGSFGAVRPSRVGGQMVDSLRPIPPTAAHPRSLSVRYGQGAFPFHTDGAADRLPPRYVFLRLAPESPASERPTVAVDFRTLRLPPSDVEALTREVWVVNSGHGRFLTPILRTTREGLLRLRFDVDCMKPMMPTFAETAHRLADACQEAEPEQIYWRPGEVLVIDNWVTLHARGTAPNSGEEERVLERVSVHA